MSQTSTHIHRTAFSVIVFSWLPDGYDDPARSHERYPVLHVNDGQNLFDPATNAFGPRECHVDEIATRLTSFVCPAPPRLVRRPVIVQTGRVIRS